MKKILKPFFSLLVLLLPFSSTYAVTGGVVGNGGDEYALQFIAVARDVVGYLSIVNPSGIKLPDLIEAIDSTKVESTNDQLNLQGVPKDAMNYPAEKRIIFNRKRWDSISNKNQKSALVLHEYLGILGVDDTGYKLSKIMLTSLEMSDPTASLTNAKTRIYKEAYGSASSSDFFESTCLFCRKYKSQAQTLARASASENLDILCRNSNGVLIDPPRIKDEACTKIKGWTSFYNCEAIVSGICEVRF